LKPSIIKRDQFNASNKGRQKKENHVTDLSHEKTEP